MFFTRIRVFAAALLLLCSGCGSVMTASYDNYDSPTDYTTDLSDENSEPVINWANLIHSEYYSGYLVVMFAEGSDLRLQDAKFVQLPATPSNPDVIPNNSTVIPAKLVLDPDRGVGIQRIDIDTSELNYLISVHGGTVERGMTISEETIEKALLRAEKEGKKLSDWNLYYRIRIDNPTEAATLLEEFGRLDYVDWAHPLQRHISEDVYEELSTSSEKSLLSFKTKTPDVQAKQGYLDSHAKTGGLNILSAWNKGITGKGVNIFDVEGNWNFDHEDLGIKKSDVLEDHLGPDFTPKFEQTHIQHGTAVVGIVAALDNNFGVKGISHSSNIKLISTNTINDAALTLGGFLKDYANYKSEIARAGDVVILTLGNGGSEGCPVSNPILCLPQEAYYSTFISIRNLSELGAIVVEASGGGNYNMDTVSYNNCAGSPCPDLSLSQDKNDNPKSIDEMISGAIMIGASEGGKSTVPGASSNCGSRVDAYAWGWNVATIGFGKDLDAAGKLIDNPISDLNDWNKKYTYSFNGTSAAAAQVAGAVALVQSYTKEFYSNKISLPKYFADHMKVNVYFDAWQMREMIKATGVQSTGACKIGYKPDVEAMILKVQDGTYTPKMDIISKSVKNAVSGIRYDMDGDGRAELISYDGGVWQIDLSKVAPNVANPNPDNYGEWDLSIDLSDMVSGGIYYPVVHDYDSDGDADLAVYDSKNGIWYIKFTTPDMVTPPLGKGGQGGILQLSWDLEIDYSNDKNWKPYARPLPGDYNGDNYLDIAIFKPDGWLAIDYGGIGRIEKNGGKIEYVSDFEGLEKKAKILTEEQLKAAPGWAYHVAVGGYGLLFRIPDGVNNAEQYATVTFKQSDKDESILDADVSLNKYHKYGGNELSFAAGFWLYSYGVGNDWKIITNLGYYLVDLPKPNLDSSDYCLPVPADYDGDGKTDFALKCYDGWRIAYYKNQGGYPPKFIKTGERVVNLSDGNGALPATIYSGGISYQDMKGILDHYNLFNEYKDKDPFTPHTVECINFWAPPPTYCLAK